jgi:hypothetical protein
MGPDPPTAIAALVEGQHSRIDLVEGVDTA